MRSSRARRTTARAGTAVNLDAVTAMGEPREQASRWLARAGVALVAAVLAGCATAPSTDAVAADGVAIDGTIASIDLQPWTFDGNAVIAVDTRDRGRVDVQLPARWNLCAASPVDVEALAVGMRVHVLGASVGDGALVVCADAAHRLAPATTRP